MFDDARLPAPLHGELCAAVSNVYWSALDGLTGQASMAATEDINSAIYHSIATAVANEMRLCNVRFSSQEKLPNEIWCTIWKSLSFLDLVAVSHVCTSWRLASRGCLSLWTSPTLYTAQSAHHNGWGCGMCSEGPNGDPGYWDYNPYPADSSNIPFIDDIFALSGDLPLHIRVDVVPYCSDAKVLERLGSALALHAHRISSLALWTEDQMTLSSVIANLDALPVLRSFSANTYYPLADPQARLPLFSRPLQLPLLERISLDEDYEWPPFLTPHLHHVRTLGFTPRDCEALLGVLEGCASLRELSLCLFHVVFLELSAQLGSRIRNLITTTRSIALDFVTHHSEPWIMATFYRPEMRHFSIGHCHAPDDAFPLSRAIFKDLHDAVSLTISTKYDSFFRSLEIMDSRGSTRAVRGCREHLTESLSSVLDPSCLQTHALRHITVALTCWDDFASARCPLTSVTSLELIVQEEPKPCNAIARVAAGSQVSPVVELKDLRIVYTGRRALVVRLGDVAGLVRRVTPSLPLHTLTLRGLLQIRGESLPDGLAQCFHVLHTLAYEQQ